MQLVSCVCVCVCHDFTFIFYLEILSYDPTNHVTRWYSAELR